MDTDFATNTAQRRVSYAPPSTSPATAMSCIDLLDDGATDDTAPRSTGNGNPNPNTSSRGDTGTDMFDLVDMSMSHAEEGISEDVAYDDVSDDDDDNDEKEKIVDHSRRRRRSGFLFGLVGGRNDDNGSNNNNNRDSDGDNNLEASQPGDVASDRSPHHDTTAEGEEPQSDHPSAVNKRTANLLQPQDSTTHHEEDEDDWCSSSRSSNNDGGPGRNIHHQDKTDDDDCSISESDAESTVDTATLQERAILGSFMFVIFAAVCTKAAGFVCGCAMKVMKLINGEDGGVGDLVDDAVAVTNQTAQSQ